MNIDLTKILTGKLVSLKSTSIIEVEIDINDTNSNSLILKCEESEKNKVKISFNGGELNVSSEGSFNSYNGIKVVLKASSLESITLSGTGNLAGVYHGQKLNIKLSGTGDISLSGSVTDLDVNISGTGDASLKNLEASNLSVKLSGTSDAKVFASKECTAIVSGIGDVTVYGNPDKFQQKISGLGSVKKVGGKKELKDMTSKINASSKNIVNSFLNDEIEKLKNDIFQNSINFSFNKGQTKEFEAFTKEQETYKELGKLKSKDNKVAKNYNNQDEIKKVVPVAEIKKDSAPVDESQRLKNKFKSML